MKVRFDFVTNSSSSSYVIKLCITTKDNEKLEFDGCIDETSGGYIRNKAACDPRAIAESDSIETLKQKLSPFSTLCENDYHIMDENGEEIGWWSESDIPGCPEDEDEYNEWYEEILYSDGFDKYAFDGFLSSIDETVKTVDRLKSISIECEGGNEQESFIKEKYEYDLQTKSFKTQHKAEEDGEDVTDEMLHDYYTIDCGDGSLEFQFADKLKVKASDSNGNNAENAKKGNNKNDEREELLKKMRSASSVSELENVIKEQAANNENAKVVQQAIKAIDHIDCSGKSFVFDGRGEVDGIGHGLYGPDDPIVKKVQEKGGEIRKSISGKTDYFVIHTDDNFVWMGAKVRDAAAQIGKRDTLTIISLKNLVEVLK